MNFYELPENIVFMQKNFDGIILEGPSPADGPWAVPGLYTARLEVDGDHSSTGFRVKKDPRLESISIQDMEEQLALALKVRDATSKANEAVIEIRTISERIRAGLMRLPAPKRKDAQSLIDALQDIASELYQTKNQSPKDKIAFPIRLNNRLSGLLAIIESGDARPTAAQYATFAKLGTQLSDILQRYGSLKRTRVADIIGTPGSGPDENNRYQYEPQ